jgi:hypothetical protein
LKKLLKNILLPVLFLALAHHVSAQDYERRVVQFSGIVAGGDSLYGIPDVAVYVPETGRGVLSNHVGYFTLPTLAGDTIKIKAMGYKEKRFIIPDTSDHITVLIRMEDDTVRLPEIILWPYPTFESFKQAFLALEDKKESVDLASRNLDEKVLRRMMYNSEASSNMNHRYFSNESATRQTTRSFVPTTALFNPFAWAKFIKDVKDGGLRNKKWEEADRYHEEEDK